MMKGDFGGERLQFGGESASLYTFSPNRTYKKKKGCINAIKNRDHGGLVIKIQGKTNDDGTSTIWEI